MTPPLPLPASLPACPYLQDLSSVRKDPPPSNLPPGPSRAAKAAVKAEQQQAALCESWRCGRMGSAVGACLGELHHGEEGQTCFPFKNNAWESDATMAGAALIALSGNICW